MTSMQSKKIFWKGLLGIVIMFTGFMYVQAEGVGVSKIVCMPGPTMASQCRVSDFASYFNNDVQLVLLLGAIASLIMFAFYYAKDVAAGAFGEQAQIHTNMKKRLLQIAGGFFGIFVCLKALSILRGAGLDPVYLKSFEYFKIFSSLLPVDHAYASEAPPLFPGGPVVWVKLLGNMVWNWVVLPGMVVGWFMSGAKYVLAQGKPEKIKEAHGYIVAVFIFSVFVIFVQGLLIVFTDALSGFFK